MTTKNDMVFIQDSKQVTAPLCTICQAPIDTEGSGPVKCVADNRGSFWHHAECESILGLYEFQTFLMSLDRYNRLD